MVNLQNQDTTTIPNDHIFPETLWILKFNLPLAIRVTFKKWGLFQAIIGLMPKCELRNAY